MHSLILASGSPRRKEILEQIGFPFTVIPSQKEEVISDEDPSEAVKRLAKMKAEDIADQVEENFVILGADTIVVLDNKILGKPKNKEEAYDMLWSLQGKTHEVFTGVSIIEQTDGKRKEFTFAQVTKVTIYPMTKEEIDRYIKTNEPMDKAGAYAIQGKFAVFIEKIEGDFYNVVGLPISSVYKVLKKEGML